MERVYVWQLPVRLFHWVNAACIVALGITGYLIGRPLAFVSAAEPYAGYWFGTVRFIHFAVAYILIFNFLVRIYYGVVGNKYATWDNFIPLKSSQWKEILHVLRVDILLGKAKPLESAGHNALAALVYFLSFLVFLAPVGTGQRRVQMIRPALPAPGSARPDWQITLELAQRLGADWHYDGPADIFTEMAAVTPQYAGMSHTRLEQGGLQWPCPTPDHPGTPILHTKVFTRGKGLFCAIPYREPAELPDAEYPLILSTGRILFHWHRGTMSRRSPGLDAIAPCAEVEIHPDDAAASHIRTGDLVKVNSRRGEVIAAAKLTRRSPLGTIFMTFHYAEAATNLLTIDAVDPTAKIPEYKVCAVKVEKVISDQ